MLYGRIICSSISNVICYNAIIRFYDTFWLRDIGINVLVFFYALSAPEGTGEGKLFASCLHTRRQRPLTVPRVPSNQLRATRSSPREVRLQLASAALSVIKTLGILLAAPFSMTTIAVASQSPAPWSLRLNWFWNYLFLPNLSHEYRRRASHLRHGRELQAGVDRRECPV